MKFILGKKLKMTQVFLPDGQLMTATVVQAGPCQVTQVKTKETDGYKAVQVGFGKKNKLTKSLLGHLKNFSQYRFLKEFRLEDGQEVKPGQMIDASAFAAGDILNVTGTSKGRGFAGPVKRYGFHGQKASHGHKDQERMPGSIGSTGPQRVLKGTRMAGHMGDAKITTTNLKVIKVEADKNLIYIHGAVPGAYNGLLVLVAEGELKEPVAPVVEEVKVEAPEIKTEEVKEEIKAEENPAPAQAEKES